MTHVERLGASGLVVGIMRDATYEEETCTLERSDVLLLFSDGLTESVYRHSPGQRPRPMT